MFHKHVPQLEILLVPYSFSSLGLKKKPSRVSTKAREIYEEIYPTGFDRLPAERDTTNASGGSIGCLESNKLHETRFRQFPARPKISCKQELGIGFWITLAQYKNQGDLLMGVLLTCFSLWRHSLSRCTSLHGTANN